LCRYGEDTVARVWEARNQFLRYQSRVDDAVVGLYKLNRVEPIA
jgi:hypothetical protein